MEGYRSGESTTTLAEVFGCSQNTVIRTVKALLPIEEYNALKVARSKREGLLDAQNLDRSGLMADKQIGLEGLKIQKDKKKHVNISNKDKNLTSLKTKKFIETEVEVSEHNMLNNAGYSISHSEDESSDREAFNTSNEYSSSKEIFQEIKPIDPNIDITQAKEVTCENLSTDVLPNVVYMLVDRAVELDARPLREFPELGSLSTVDQERKTLCLFSNQRSAKRSCGRSQRVIKIPDSNVFILSKPFLLARGITRLLLEDVLIALDQ